MSMKEGRPADMRDHRPAAAGLALYNAVRPQWAERELAERFIRAIEGPDTGEDEPVLARWLAEAEKGPEEAARALAVMENVVVRHADIGALLRDHAERLLPVQRLRLAVRAWEWAEVGTRVMLRRLIEANLHVLHGEKSPSPSSSLTAAGTGGFLTASQRAVFGRLCELADAYFSGLGADQAIKPRFQPLITGPSGTGKTELGRKLATACSAHFLKISVGEWVPVSAKSEPWTLYRILEACRQHERTILYLDEIDKQHSGFSASWGQSVMAEVFSMLDGDIALDSFCERKRDVDRETLQRRVRQGLFRLGAGTWQTEWRQGVALGFNQSGRRDDAVERIMAQPVIPPEFLLRFSLPPLVLQYPTAGETAEIFTQSGITELAARAGVPLQPETHDWTRGGLRTLETLATDLWLRIQRGEGGWVS